MTVHNSENFTVVAHSIPSTSTLALDLTSLAATRADAELPRPFMLLTARQ